MQLSSCFLAEQTVPSCAHVSAGTLLSSDAGIAGLAPSKGAERVMLCLDDELAGLIEAADMPADQHGTHTTQPDAVSLVPGEISPHIISQLLCTLPFALLWHSLGGALRCAALCCVALCCSVLRCAALCCAVLCCAVL